MVVMKLIERLSCVIRSLKNCVVSDVIWFDGVYGDAVHVTVVEELQMIIEELKQKGLEGMSEQTQTAEQWGIVDLFGHTRLAGKISEYPFGGDSFVRLDIPEAGDQPAHTRLFGKGAIYSISFTSKEIAVAAANHQQARPVTQYDFDEQTRSRLRALPVSPPVNDD